MEKNIVVKRLEEIIGTDALAFLSGEIKDCGKDECSLTGERGSVYGIAIKIKNETDKQIIFDKLKKDCKTSKQLKSVSDWKEIGDNFYPLYWGKDINMGIRIYSHTKVMKSTGTIQLNKIGCLIDKELIYGVYPCSGYEEKEELLRERFPDLLKTRKGKKNQLLMKDVNKDD